MEKTAQRPTDVSQTDASLRLIVVAAILLVLGMMLALYSKVSVIYFPVLIKWQWTSTTASLLNLFGGAYFCFESMFARVRQEGATISSTK